MNTQLHYLAKEIRTQIIEIDNLGYIFNELIEKYLDGYAEDESEDHPLRKLKECKSSIYNSNCRIMEKLLEENLLDPSFRKELQKLALMDRLRDGNWENKFVEFVDRHIKD